MLAARGVIEWSSIAGERVDGLKLKTKRINRNDSGSPVIFITGKCGFSGITVR